MNLTKFSRPYSHFGIVIFEQEEEKRGNPLYQTWHIVNSITLYHITSHSIMSYQMVFHPIILSYQITSPHIPSYPILFCPILFYPIISYPVIISHQTAIAQSIAAAHFLQGLARASQGFSIG